MNQRHFKRSQFPSPICPCQFWIHKLWQPTPAGLSFWNELEMTASVGVQQGYLDMFCKITLPETNSKKKHLKIPGVLRSDEAFLFGGCKASLSCRHPFFPVRGPWSWLSVQLLYCLVYAGIPPVFCWVISCFQMGGVAKMVVPQNGWVYNGNHWENPIKMDDLEDNPPFKETPKSTPINPKRNWCQRWPQIRFHEDSLGERWYLAPWWHGDDDDGDDDDDDDDDHYHHYQ